MLWHPGAFNDTELLCIRNLISLVVELSLWIVILEIICIGIPYPVAYMYVHMEINNVNVYYLYLLYLVTRKKN